ncbi:hypothetical protein BY996DRAFT_6796131 [Phakopsora pachyrhizi]|nr:hypothetical protein BY996DRAFT_6796131 [Phakopsora pachyrhizi]
MVVVKIHPNLIEAEVSSGDHMRKTVYILRISLDSSKSNGLPFNFIRKQFPNQVAFAFTINKSQGQTLGTVGVYLHDPVFSHGQLYVALSRSKSMQSTKVLLNQLENETASVSTKYFVYREVLRTIH